jgi:class 3 adenylate cyclase
LENKIAMESITSEPILQWVDEHGVPHRRNLTDKIFLGRVCSGIEREKCIIIADPVVSRDHAMVRRTRYGVEITDMSKNGTWINSVRMTPGDSRRLKDGDRISLGDASIRLTYPVSAPQPEPEEDDFAEQTAISPSMVYITSLVADIRGFTALSQKADSAKICAFIEKVFTRFSAIVSEHKGTVEGYFGDAIFAFWEHPGEGSADRAIWACQAAISQLYSVPPIHRKLMDQGVVMPPLVLGWGMTTGPITLSRYGTRSADLALVGDCVNLAFRLSSMANKTLSAPIVMCRQTASLVKQSMPLLDLGNQKIRGRKGVEHLFGIRLE